MSTTALRVAIIGGGIGGATAANALLQRGMEVHIYEQASALTEVGAGVAIQPNGLRMLRRLGFGADVLRLGVRWIDPQFRRADGTFITMQWPPEQADQIEFYGLHRADLLGMLVDRLPAGTITTGQHCVGFEQDDGQAVVSFANGERVAADVVVAADGIHSTLQRYVVTPSPPLPSGWMAYRGLVSAANVAWPLGAQRNWLGDGKHFLVYPVRANQLVNYVGIVPTDEQLKESWSAPGDPTVLAQEFAGWDPLVGAIIAQVRETFRWGLYDREPLPAWTQGRLTLLGDAAHPMLPHGGQGANQAIEDGAALAAVLADADRTTAPAALLVYESVRRERTARLQQAARRIAATRRDGARPDADLSSRDRDLAQARDRSWVWDYDAEAEAAAAMARR